jgi:hypothetical protein
MIIKRAETLILLSYLQGLIQPDQMARLLAKRPSLFKRWQDYEKQGQTLSDWRLEHEPVYQ